MSTMHKHDAAPLSVQQIIDAIVGCEASVDELSEMIAAALADARRDGAEQMRAESAKLTRKEPLYYSSGEPAEEELAQAIEDLPMPAGERQAVLLTDAKVKQIGDATLYAGGIYDRVRAIETAVLAANGMEVRRG